MALLILSFLALAIWLTMIFARGGFWRGRENTDCLPQASAEQAAGLSVAAIVPARDEAETIARCVRSLLAQNCAADFRIVVVDDQSSDGTGDIVRAIAQAQNAIDRIVVLRSQDPPPGWTGKINAMRFGLAHVATWARPPDYVWFTDADIAHAPDALAHLLGGARAQGRVLVSSMALLACQSQAERWLTPAFVYFFQMLYPFAFVNDPHKRLAGAAGGCMLVERAALERAGGLEAIKDALIDDCALGAAMKRVGPIWLGLTRQVHSLRPYPHVRDIRKMVTRSAYAQLNYSPLQLLGSLAGLTLTFLVPPALAFHPNFLVGGPAALAYGLMIVSYRPMLRFYGLSAWRAPFLPLIAALYMAFTLESAIDYARGRGGAWKGRLQAIKK